MATLEVNTDSLPKVVRIRRSRGEIVQDCDIYLGRMVEKGGWDLPHSDWANPFTIWDTGSRRNTLRRYEYYIRHQRPDLWRRLPELEGKTLGCWCKPEPCHGDVLVQLFKEHKANSHKGPMSDVPKDTQTDHTDTRGYKRLIDNDESEHIFKKSASV